MVENITAEQETSSSRSGKPYLHKCVFRKPSSKQSARQKKAVKWKITEKFMSRCARYDRFASLMKRIEGWLGKTNSV